MADQRNMAELLCAPTEGYAEAIVVPPILAEYFKLKHSLINMMTSNQFFGLEKDNPHDHIHWFNKITSIIKYKDVPNSAIKLMLFPFSLAGAACRWLEKEPPRSILIWEDLVSKFINEFFPPSRTKNLRNEISNIQQCFDESFHEAWDRYKDLLHACPHHGFTELHQLETFYNALNPADQDSLNSVVGGNLLERHTQQVLTIIENKSKIAKLTYAVNQQTSDVIAATTAILKQFQATPPPASIKAIEEICVTCGGSYPYYQCLVTDGNTFLEFQDNIQGYVSAAAVNYNQGNFGYCPSSVANQILPSGFAQLNMQNNQNRFSQSQGYNRGNNFNQDTSYQAPIQQNQVVPLSEFEKIKKINEINIKAMQAQINNLKNKLRNDMQTLTQASMSKQTNELKNMMASFFQMNTASTSGSGPLPRNIIANPKALLSNKEKLLELANTPLNENYSAVILKNLPEKLGDLGKFLISCGFSELKCKALAYLGSSINLMPLLFCKKLGLPEFISTRMTLELANRAICTPVRIARDVFVPVGKFTFPDDFVIVDYESDPRVPLILVRPFLRTDRALINIHGEEMILFINPLSGNTTSSSPGHFLEEFADELALITFPPRNDDLLFDIESDLKEIEYLLNHDPTKEMDSILKDSVDECNLVDPNNDLVDTIPEMFTDEHTLDYSSLPLYDDVDDDLVELESDNDDVYDDPFDSKEDKIKESKLLIDELDPLRSSDFLPSPECNSVLYEYFSKVDALPSNNNKDKDFLDFEDSCSWFCPSITRSSHPQLHFGNPIS
nr:reverse transcriptase domain-containing protein [Tanacetum cinerariifolium]